MSDVFISYASEDRERARVLASALEATGVSVWWDRRLRPGQSFAEVIEEALASAKCAIVLWSPASATSNWVRGEAGEALSRGILIPALIEETRIPLEFRRFHAANLIDWTDDISDPELQSLLGEVRGFLEDSSVARLEQPPGTVVAGAPALVQADADDPRERAAELARLQKLLQRVSAAAAPVAFQSPREPASRPSTAWSAELLAQESTRRLLRVALSEDTHLVEYRSQLSGETVSVDGIEVARAGSLFQFVGHHEFEIPDGPRKRPAIIDATAAWFSGLDAFRLLVDDHAVYTEGELEDSADR